ncbi:hypothetical protein C8J56DRAFT_1054559 [Mycena floridula]|nr:hypothetical protein C8J56DRAFT_1054559 [Mycena floridula]
MNSDAIEPFPELPFEIVCLIIEAILKIEPRKAVELVYLSRDIQLIVERALHRCIILKSHPAANSFLDMLKSRHPDTIQHQAKVLCCIVDLTIATLHSIFSACSGLQTIGIFIWDDEYEALTLDAALDDLAAAGPLTVSLSPSFPKRHPFGARLPAAAPHAFRRKGPSLLGKFNPLLHLADSIVVCIFYPNCDYGDLLQDPATDPRIIIAIDPDQRDDQNGSILWRDLNDCRHYLRQWGRRLDGEELDMWGEAEEIVKVQRAKLAAAERLQTRI